MTVRSNDRPEHQVERRKNPRAESSMHYRRLRQEAEPPPTIAAAAEGLFAWIDRAGERVSAALANLFGTPRKESGGAGGISDRERRVKSL